MRLQGKNLQNATNTIHQSLNKLLSSCFKKLPAVRGHNRQRGRGCLEEIVIRQLRFSFRPSTRVGSVRYLSRASADPVINYKNGGGW